jgi:phosphatidylserine/phosphatidylglycerophosphate/cardiolipin synthase-like enzyme
MTLVFPDHELYSTLLNEHNGDFRNSDAKSVPPEQGPREPWHDIHSKVEGPIAGDVFKNFYERWQKQVRLICFSLLMKKQKSSYSGRRLIG